MSNTGDPMVRATQIWLNRTYGDDTRFNIIPENVYGRTGWTTIYALTRALQIELGIQNTADNFGPTTQRLFTTLTKDNVCKNIYGILQGALWCKGYNTGHYGIMVDNEYVIDTSFDDSVEIAVKALETDAGRTTPTGEVDLNLMKALLSMDAFKKVYGGDNKIRQIQQYLNKNYEAYIGLRPCDGIYSRSTNAALIYALQAEEGLPIGTANGNFGPTTQRCCPSIPYNNVEKSYNGSTYSETKIGKMVLLLKFGLYFNGFNPFNQIDLDIQDVIYDDKTISTLKQFQNHYKLFPDGKSDLSTWLAIFVSCGDTSRSCDASDTRFEMTDDRIQYLKNNNISIVGRYLTGGDFKQLRTGEAERILASGLSFFPIFQESGTNLTYFTPERGIQDAQTATLAAKSYKIPRGSIIYFAVDTDPQDAEIYNYILPYFKALRNEMYNNLDGYYKIGIYATRNASNQVINKGYALTCFVSDMSTGFSGNMGFKIPHNWNLDQFYEIKSISTASGIWDLDKVAYSGKFPVVTSLDVESENENNGLIILKNKLLQLYDYAETYLINAGRSHTTKECNMLVLNYLRSPDYSGNLWTMTAGEIDYGFINYIDSFNDTTLHPYNILIPTEYGNMGITHLAATLNSLQANLLVVNSTVDDLSGWAGDLLQLGCVYCGLTDEETAVNTEDLYLMIACQDDALANKYLGKDGSLHSATELGFSLEDWEQDIDAVSINKELNKEKKIYDAFYDYYTIFYEERYINIVNEIIDYENCESLQEKLLEKVKYYTHLNHLASVVFVDHFSEEYGDYSKSKIADALAEQFVNKLWYYYNR